MPKVSVIVPVFNTASYLERCLSSIALQTFTDFEVWVIDDGSTDGSEAIIKHWMQKDNRIQGIYQSNAGLSMARNNGISHAQGQYLAFVDSDDWVHPDMLKFLYQAVDEYEADMAFCDLIKTNGVDQAVLYQSDGGQMVLQHQDLMRWWGEMGCFACNKLFKKSLFNDLMFMPQWHFEDIALIPQLVLRCQTVVAVPQALYYYYTRSESISRNHTIKGLDLLKSVDLVYEAFIQYPHSSLWFKRFCILQGFYSYLAYLAYLPKGFDKNIMVDALKQHLQKHRISIKDIILYKRFGQNYWVHLPLKKKLYYCLAFIHLNGLKYV